MARITRDDLQALGLDEDAQSLILDKQDAKAPARTHFKHWVYLTEEQATTLADLYQDDPEFRMVKYSHVRKARNNGRELERIDI